MKTQLKQLWQDERGAVISIELVLMGTIVLLGLIVGLAAFRDSIVQELADTGNAVGELNQSYAVLVNANGGDANTGPAITVANDVVTVSRNFSVMTSGGATVTGVSVTSTFNNYSYQDLPDVCENTTQTAGNPPAGIQFQAPGANETGANPTPSFP